MIQIFLFINWLQHLKIISFVISNYYIGNYGIIDIFLI